MQERIKFLPSDDTVEGSTNFGKFIEYFSTDDSKWIQIINKALEETTKEVLSYSNTQSPNLVSMSPL